LREGFQHEIELITTAQNIMGKLNNLSPNCQLRIKLKDLYDTVVAVIDTLVEDNTFNFVNIRPGNYKVIFQPMNKECKNTEFSYTFTGATPFIISQSNRNMPDDSFDEFNINGKISAENSSKIPKGTICKLINPDGKVEATTPLSSDGQFKYEHLNSSKYTVAYHDPVDKSKLEYNVTDKKDNLIKKYSYTYLGNKKNQPNAKDTSIKRNVSVSGKVILTNPSVKTNVLLIDSVGKIRKEIPLNPDGTFVFKELTKNKYRVAFETSDPKITGKLTYNVYDPYAIPIRIKAKELYSVVEKTDTIYLTAHNIKVKEKTIEKNINSDKDRQKEKEKTVAVKITNPQDTAVIMGVTRFELSNFKVKQTYNQDKIIVHPTGYGIQINAFIDTINLKKHILQLKREGKKNFFIQVVDKFNDNSLILYRIIIGQYDTIEKAQEAALLLKQEGYETVVIKHLEPTKSP
jgi:hypothetical protein